MPPPDAVQGVPPGLLAEPLPGPQPDVSGVPAGLVAEPIQKPAAAPQSTAQRAPRPAQAGPPPPTAGQPESRFLAGGEYKPPSQVPQPKLTQTFSPDLVSPQAAADLPPAPAAQPAPPAAAPHIPGLVSEALGEAGKVGVAAAHWLLPSPEKVQAVGKESDAAQKALISPETVMGAIEYMPTDPNDSPDKASARAKAMQTPKYREAHPVYSGVAAGAAQLVSGFTSLENLVLMAATGGLEGVVAKAASGIFAAQAAHGAYKDAGEALEAFRQGKNADAAQSLTKAFGSAVVAAAAGAHAANLRGYTGAYGERGVRVGSDKTGADIGYRPAYREPGPTGSYSPEEGSRAVPGSPVVRVRAGGGETMAGAAPAAPEAPAPKELGAGEPVPRGTEELGTKGQGDKGPEAPPIGTTEPETGRPVLQEGETPKEIQKAATEEHPQVKAALGEVVAQVPGAELAAARPKKEPDRLEEKIEDEGQSPRTARDYSGFRIAVDSPGAAQAVANSLRQRFEVHAEQDHFAEGDEDLGFHAHTLNVREPGSDVTHEVQILPREVAENADRDHALYEKARDGDQQATAQLKERNEQNWKDFEARNKDSDYRFGSTQANLPPDSPASQAIERFRAGIPASDLAGQGKEIGDGGNHVTVRYGIQSGDIEGIRKFIESQPAFTARLGATDVFPPTKHSDGAAVVHAPVESPELARLNAEIEKHGDFAPSSFAEYKPHVTVAYVDPKFAEQYKGRKDLAGAEFPVTSVVISDRHGNQVTVPLKGGPHAGSIGSAEALAIHGGRPGETGLGGRQGVAGVERGPEAAGAQAPRPGTSAAAAGSEAAVSGRQPETKEPATERRVNPGERKRVEEMTPEEMRQTLLVSDKTGLPNKRAFEEAERQAPAAAIGMSDADGLKAFNDRFGYAAGDQLLQAKADALKAAGLDAYHDKGDEFLYRGATPEDLRARLEKARENLRNRVIEVTTKDGQVKAYKGADFSYGTGTELAGAEAGLKEHKGTRERAGERKRGELRGVAEARPESGPADQGETGGGELAPGAVGSVPTGDLHLAPKRFQYKLDVDASGVTNLLKGQKWNPDLAGVVSVWRDPADGKLYVVNGHHRAQLAKENRVPRLNVLHIPAATAEEARATAALQNIAEGRGTVIDAAKFFRDSGISLGDLEGEGHLARRSDGRKRHGAGAARPAALRQGCLRADARGPRGGDWRGDRCARAAGSHSQTDRAARDARPPRGGRHRRRAGAHGEPGPGAHRNPGEPVWRG